MGGSESKGTGKPVESRDHSVLRPSTGPMIRFRRSPDRPSPNPARWVLPDSCPLGPPGFLPSGIQNVEYSIRLSNIFDGGDSIVTSQNGEYSIGYSNISQCRESDVDFPKC